MVPAQKTHENSSAPSPSSSSSSSSRRTPLRLRSLVAGFLYGFVMELAFIASKGYIQTMVTEEGSHSAASRAVDYDVVDDAAGGGRMLSLGGNSLTPAAVPTSTTMQRGDTERLSIINDNYGYDYHNTILDSGSISSGHRHGDGHSFVHDDLYGLYSDNFLLLFIILLWVALWRQHREHRREEVQRIKERQRRRQENHDTYDAISVSCHSRWSAAMTSSIVWALGVLFGTVVAFGIISGLAPAILRLDFCVCWLSYLLGICILVTAYMTADDDDATSCTSFADDVITDGQVPLPGQQQQHSEVRIRRHEGTGLVGSYFLLEHVV